MESHNFSRGKHPPHWTPRLRPTEYKFTYEVTVELAKGPFAPNVVRYVVRQYVDVHSRSAMQCMQQRIRYEYDDMRRRTAPLLV